MNTKRNLLFITLLCLFAGFASCTKDDKDDDYAAAIAGKYTGTVTIDGAPVTQNTVIDVARESNSSATLAMKETILGLPIDITCKTDITFANNTYALSGATTYNMPTDAAATTIPVPVKITGTVDQNGNATLNIQVDIPGMPVTAVYTGKK